MRRVRPMPFDSGFTLIELMLVVVIVAILALAAAGLYQSSVTHARMSEGISAVGVIRSAFRIYSASNNGQYPVLTAVDGTGLDPINLDASDLSGKYFSPSNYTVSSTASSYTITATEPRSGLKYQIDQDGTETQGDGYYSTASGS